MTDATDHLPAQTKAGFQPAGRLFGRLWHGNTLPILVVVLAIVVLWYLAAIWLNARWQIQTFERQDVIDWTAIDFIAGVWNQARPVMPTPHQVFAEIWATTVGQAPTSPRSLLFHAWVTLSSTMLGFVIGTALGILLAISIVHNKAMDRSVMPWIIASQTIPILAIAPMIVVVMNTIDIYGFKFPPIVSKGLISTYLSFFPITVGMVTGFRSPERIQLDLMHTYSASRRQTFFKLRWPAALPYLFTSMKVGVAIALTGAIVAELPTGGVAGLGARLLSGSYYGQTVQIWSALFMAAFLAACLVMAVGAAQKITFKAMGGMR